MVEPPYWLTNKGVNQIDVAEYDHLRKEFMTIMNAEETEDSRSFPSTHTGEIPLRLSEVMERAWKHGTFWYSLALSSSTGLFHLFYERIRPLLSKHCPENMSGSMPFYWRKDVEDFVEGKLAAKERYDYELQQAFAAGSKWSSFGQLIGVLNQGRI